MSIKLDSKSNPDLPMIYQIRTKGHLGSQWSDWFDDLTITMEEDGNSMLSGPIVDDATLYGLLKKVRNLGMLLSQPSVSNPPVVNFILTWNSGAIR